MKNIIQLDAIPVLLNNLYKPIIKAGKPALIKNPEANEFKRIAQMVARHQRSQVLSGDLSFQMDILINSRRNYDIDAPIKLLFDSLEGIAYKNDNQIMELIIRKHLKADRDGLVMKIEQLS